MPRFAEKRAEYEQGLSSEPGGSKLRVLPSEKRPSAGLLVEAAYVWLVAIIVFNFSFFLRPRSSLFLLDPKNDFLTKVIDVAAVFAAYALTVITVLPALNDRTAVQRLRRGGQYGIFSSYISSALYANGWIVIFGLTLKLFFEKISATNFLASILSAVWWASCAFAAAALFRASRLLLKIVSV